MAGPQANFTPQQRARLVAIAIALAAIAGTTAIGFRPELFEAASESALLDGGMSRRSGPSRVTDLLTGPVAPGETITTYVALPLGSTVTDTAFNGPNWTVLSQDTSASGATTVFTITVRNDGVARRRFVGFVSFDVPVIDAGIADGP